MHWHGYYGSSSSAALFPACCTPRDGRTHAFLRRSFVLYRVSRAGKGERPRKYLLEMGNAMCAEDTGGTSPAADCDCPFPPCCVVQTYASEVPPTRAGRATSSIISPGSRASRSPGRRRIYRQTDIASSSPATEPQEHVRSFVIVHVGSGLVLDVNTRNETVQLWKRRGHGDRRNQEWRCDPVNGAIVSSYNGKALDIDAKDGKSLIVWRTTGKCNQEWILDSWHNYMEDGFYGNVIRNPKTGKTLQSDGRVVQAEFPPPREDFEPFGEGVGHNGHWKLEDTTWHSGLWSREKDIDQHQSTGGRDGGMASFGAHTDTVGIQFLQSKAAALSASSADAAALISALRGSTSAPPQSLPDVMLLGLSARLSLMQHIDKHRLSTGKSNPDLVLALSLAELEVMVGGSTVQQLVERFGTRPTTIRLRRVEATGDAASCVAFHTDYTNALVSLRTMQIPLNEPTEYDGGELVWAVEDGLEVPSRAAGSATLHSAGVVHGVTAMTRGQRYSLFLLELKKPANDK